MIANALLFTIITMLGYGFWLLDQLNFMAQYRTVLCHTYGPTILIFVAVLSLNLFSWRIGNRPAIFSQEHWAQALPSRQAVHDHPFGRASSCE